MNITINTKVLEKYDLSLEEFMLLYLGYKEVNITQTIEDIIAKGLANSDLFTSGRLVVSNNVAKIISSIILDSDKEVDDSDERFFSLAVKLKELYPAGRKAGTTYMWRGNTAEIAKKLKTLVVKYKFNFTDDQVINATRSYVASFNGNYTKMRLLKYFILKSERDADNNTNVISELMSIIENEDQHSTEDNDWTSTLI